MRTTLAFLAAMLLLGVLFTAQFDPGSPLFWEASLAPGVMLLRGVLACVLLWFLIYTPETPWLRLSAGLSAGLLAIWIADATYGGMLGFVDAMTLTPPVIAVFVALLESKPTDEPFGSFELAGELRRQGVQRTKAFVIYGSQLSWLLFTDVRLVLDEDKPPATAKVRFV